MNGRQKRVAETSVASSPAAQPTLGQRLKIRSMVTMAGEVLPFFWPMRNFIHHNPLHGLEHLPFEQAVAEATRLFHAHGWLRRNEYQRMLAEGEISLPVLKAMVSARVDAWLVEQGDDPAHCKQAPLLKRLLLAMLTSMDQPAPGGRSPCAEEVVKCLRSQEP